MSPIVVARHTRTGSVRRMAASSDIPRTSIAASNVPGTSHPKFIPVTAMSSAEECVSSPRSRIASSARFTAGRISRHTACHLPSWNDMSPQMLRGGTV